MNIKKHYYLLLLDILSCTFFLGWILYSFKNNNDAWVKCTWIFLEAICLFNALREARIIYLNSKKRS